MSSGSPFEIVFLADEPLWAHNVAVTTWEEWPDVYRDYGLNSVQEVEKCLLENNLNRDSIPLTLILRSSSQPHEFIGTVGIEEDDMVNRPEITPCLVSMYVEPKFRGKGFSKVLMNKLIDVAKTRLKLDKMYLWTQEQQELYKRFGWKSIEETSYLDRTNCTIMELELSKAIVVD